MSEGTNHLFPPYPFRFSLRPMSDSSCLVISSAAPRSHDQGVWLLCRVMRLPVPMLMGEKLMGVFSPLAHHRSLVLLEWGLATWMTLKPPQHRPPRIKLPAWEKGFLNHFAYNAALDPPWGALFAFVCVRFIINLISKHFYSHYVAIGTSTATILDTLLIKKQQQQQRLNIHFGCNFTGLE